MKWKTYFYQIDNIWEIIQIGDSLHKPANSFVVYIYPADKKKKMIKLKAYSCFCGDSIPKNCADKIKK